MQNHGRQLHAGHAPSVTARELVAHAELARRVSAPAANDAVVEDGASVKSTCSDFERGPRKRDRLNRRRVLFGRYPLRVRAPDPELPELIVPEAPDATVVEHCAQVDVEQAN